ncbi:hypothetical protein [Caballeronia zhejiangensis]|uniref:Uncharacterized protein n=1 Tax=Caballeronia zhejiangensis TaxID=871203 RepID=A0A656QBR4_9BURK|nr:hypothetical protein [Caballeronia zhejiangensis]KDR25475.1 hypothetical protein BG60_28475 [Caballeronia zhejiangensis]
MTNDELEQYIYSRTRQFVGAHVLEVINELLSASIADTPRYAEWKHLRTHGQWRDGVPSWARGHNKTMDDMTAAVAVIEELAAALSSGASIADTASLSDAQIDWIVQSGRAFSYDEIRAKIGKVREASIADTAGEKEDETLSLANADWRNLYDMVYGHECSFKSFMMTVDDLAAPPAPSVANALEDRSKEEAAQIGYSKMTREIYDPELIEIAQRCARKTHEGHRYLPTTNKDQDNFRPHDWVIDAMREAIKASKKVPK